MNGEAGSGKTHLLDRINALFYGPVPIGTGTLAAYKKYASTMPLILLDNIQHMKPSWNNYLYSLTRSVEKPRRGLGMVTSIAPSSPPPVLTGGRVMHVTLSTKEWGNTRYSHEDALGYISATRPYILRAIHRVTSDVLGNFEKTVEYWSSARIRNHMNLEPDLITHVATILAMMERLMEEPAFDYEGMGNPREQAEFMYDIWKK